MGAATIESGGVKEEVGRTPGAGWGERDVENTLEEGDDVAGGVDEDEALRTLRGSVSGRTRSERDERTYSVQLV